MSKGCLHVIPAHPKENGFYGARGIAGHIPSVYLFMPQELLHALTDAAQAHRVALCEVAPKGWTFGADNSHPQCSVLLRTQGGDDGAWTFWSHDPLATGVACDMGCVVN